MQRYQVVKKLGTGTYGSAYLVNSKSDASQQYVLKKVQVKEGENSADSEVKVLRSLSHPLVLSYVDHFMYKGHLCIITEYCDAGDLYQLLRARKAPLPEPQLLDLFAQVLLAIQHVHSKNILHRDLKTQNIFLTSGGSIRLGDFGISRPLNGTMDLASTLIGTPYYMSPEVMSSMPYDFKSDMWSLGCVLYEMMSLKHAFDASDMSSLVLKILRGEHLPIPSSFSPELQDLVRQLLSKNPKMRPSPEQMVKMSFLREYVARARDTVAGLEQQRQQQRAGRLGGRRLEASPGPQGSTSYHRHSLGAMDLAAAGGGAGSGPGSGGGAAGLPPASSGRDAPGSGSIDRELDAAKERLRRIKLEREALLKQAAAGNAGAGAGAGAGSRYHSAVPHASPPPLSGQHSESNMAARVSPGMGVPVPVGAGPASAAALRGKSWRDKEEQMQRLQARSSQRELPLEQPGAYAHLAGDVDAALGRHREARALRGSRPQSPELLPGAGSVGPGSGGGGGADGVLQVAGSPPGGTGMDPKARMRVRKEEEARRREAELLNARKAYFEERKHAAARLAQLYNPSAANHVAAGTGRRATECSSSGHLDGHGLGGGGGGGPYGSSHLQQQSSHAHHHQHHLSGGGTGHISFATDDGAGGGGLYSSPSAQHYAYGQRGAQLISDSDDDLNEPYSGGGYGEAGAAQEFEAELSPPGAAQQTPQPAAPAPALQAALDRGGLADRIMALREVCAHNLGQPLYELIYGYIRKRMAQGLSDDPAFRSELMARLGGGRMQYVHLIDQLIYFEDMQGLTAPLQAALG